MTLDADTIARFMVRIERLYPNQVDDCLKQVVSLVEKYRQLLGETLPRAWDQRDVFLITYGDQVQGDGGTSLSYLARFLKETGLDELINTVHILPFCPYSSDDGFSVIDYRQVDPLLGDWDDVAKLRERGELMFDLVLNHCSQHSEWFQAYLRGEAPYDEYFIAVDPATDLSEVTRPRSLPLLSPYETTQGRKHVWTTFSADQVDLNFGNPAVLIEMLDVLLGYAERGAGVIRLDAIAYLWKTIGTPCIHLPQTHEVVKLMRDVLEAAAPDVWLLTETNVPHDENVSYFGNGDEAQMVYQFSLPPLLLTALLQQDGGPLARWMESLDQTPEGTTFFNFTASHDGVGVRPLEGLVDAERFQELVDAVEERGGHISTKRNADGSDSPYEMNVAYFDALGESGEMPTELHVRRFLTSQALMLAQKGVPGVYFHSLVGTPNDQQGVEESGHARRINRHKYSYDRLMEVLADDASAQKQVFDGYRDLLRVRIAQPAFHPSGEQLVIFLEDSKWFAFSRISPDRKQQILVLANLRDEEAIISLPAEFATFTTDLLGSAGFVLAGKVLLPAYGVCWLVGG